MASVNDIQIGDRVQISDSGIDVTNGVRAKAGRLYGDGGPLWAEVVAIVENWPVPASFGIGTSVTKVRCSNNGVVVWQVRPQDICNIIKANPEPPAPTPPAPTPPEPAIPKEALAQVNNTNTTMQTIDIGASNGPFATQRSSEVWNTGTVSNPKPGVTTGPPRDMPVPYISDSMFSDNSSNSSPKYVKQSTAIYGAAPNVWASAELYRAEYLTNWSNAGRKSELLNTKQDLIQNDHKYPAYIGQTNQNEVAKYDYRVLPDDKRLTPRPTGLMEDRLMKLRASLGLPVHGNNEIARSMKYYMYNRFKVPDTNLAHTKHTSHVFFTRPDLNLLDTGAKANAQTINNTESAMIWRRHPEVFKMLTDYRRCGDSNNFNMLLSNQINSFQVADEELGQIRHGRSWNEHEMQYGDSYTGRTAGTLSCTFTETADFAVMNLIKLWMAYIDNVSRGAWSPSYNLTYLPEKVAGLNLTPTQSHVFDRALDYAASVYMFKCGPDGEDVIYWTKYYGVFPINSGASSLNWEMNGPGDTPKLSINFAYSYKRDMNPMTLVEFNDVAALLDNEANWIPSFTTDFNGEKTGYSTRPFVGTPYIEMDLGVPNLAQNDVSRGVKRTQIRLKFREDKQDSRRDEILYRVNPTKSL